MSRLSVSPHPTSAELDAFAASGERACTGVAALPLDEAGARLAEDGLLGILAPEPFGLGLHPAYAESLVAAAARARLAYPLAETLAASAALARLDPDVAVAVLEGGVLVTVTGLAEVTARRDRGGVVLDGVAGDLLHLDAARWALLPVGEGESLVLIDLDADGLTVEPAGDMDVSRPRGRLRLAGVAVPAGRILTETSVVDEFRAGLALFRAIDACAAAGAALDLAVTHLSTRTQFGRPLVGFQALRHDLARARMLMENAARLFEGGLAAEEGERAGRADLAHAYAAEIAPRIAEAALQMHGGMGFTWDVPVHLYLRRIRAGFSANGLDAARGRVAERAIAGALAPLPD